jgi:hypothetical protein
MEFIGFLNEYPGKKQKGPINAWFRLGAQWWDRKIDFETVTRKVGCTS